MEPTPPASSIRADILAAATHRLHRFYANPTTPPVARVIVVHGYGDHAGKHLHVLQWLADHGIAASVTDFRGHGRSTGRVAHVDCWEEYLDDLQVMLGVGTEDRGSRIDDRKGQPASSRDPRSSILDPLASPAIPTFLLAHSHGGLIAIIAALRGLLEGCSGVIFSAPYLELKIPVPGAKRIAAEIASRVWPSLPFKTGIAGPMLTHDENFIEINKTDRYCPGIATPRWFTTTRKMQAEARASADKFKLPLLMLVAGEDVIADSRAAIEFYENAGSLDKQILQYPTYRHELLREAGREAIFESMLEWIRVRTNQ